MPPSKCSPIWDYFKEDPLDYSWAICQVPGCRLGRISRGKSGKPRSSMTTGVLDKHLLTHHPKKYGDFLQRKSVKVNENKRKAEEDNEMENANIPHSNLRNNNERKKYLTQSSLQNWVGQGSFSQSSSSVYDINDIRAKDRHRGVLMMVINDLQPFTIVNDPGFLHMMFTMDPHYKVCSDRFYRNLLDKIYKHGVKGIETKIRDDKPKYISCQIDGWSSYRHGYSGLIVNYITPGWKRVNICLECSEFSERHTSENIASWLDDKLNKWKVAEETFAVVSDTASNMLGMMAHLPNFMLHVDCLCHVINLTVKDEVLLKPELASLIGNVRIFSNAAANSLIVGENLQSKMVDLGWEENEMLALVQDVPTRWNSTLDMLERFLMLEDPIKKLLEDESMKASMKNKASTVKFSSSDWRLMRNVSAVLRPFKEATEVLSKSDACISVAIPTVSSILLTLEPSGNDKDLGVKDLKSRLKTNFERRTAAMETNHLYSVATLLDVMYKGYFFRSPYAKEKAKEKLVELVSEEYSLLESPSLEATEINPDEPETLGPAPSSLASAFERIRQKSGGKQFKNQAPNETIQSVVDKLVADPCEKEGNLKWWAKYEMEANTKGDRAKQAICSIARKYLTPPPASVNVERLFSSAGQTMDEKRARLKPENLDKILFLRENSVVNNFRLNW